MLSEFLMNVALFAINLNYSNMCTTHITHCVASLQKGLDVAKKTLRFLFILIEQIMTNLSQKKKLAFNHKYLRS